MVRIAELSKEVAKEYREDKKNKLQRTFVSGTSAAESKATSKFTYCFELVSRSSVFYFLGTRRSDPGTYTSYGKRPR